MEEQILALASTEPRSFERGNRQLQATPAALDPASTEPRSFERGNDGHVILPDAVWVLQRSRVLSNAETLRRPFVVSEHCAASTEPRSFERGNEE